MRSPLLKWVEKPNDYIELHESECQTWGIHLEEDSYGDAICFRAKRFDEIGRGTPFTDLDCAKKWCQEQHTARLKAAEKWTSQPPVEPGDYFILPPHGLRSAITCGAWQIQQFKERPGYWPKGTLFRKIDEPEEPYDFSNT